METNTKRPGAPRVKFTKTVKFRVDGNMLTPLGKGKPAKDAQYVTKDMPFDWVRQAIPA